MQLPVLHPCGVGLVLCAAAALSAPMQQPESPPAAGGSKVVLANRRTKGAVKYLRTSFHSDFKQLYEGGDSLLFPPIQGTTDLAQVVREVVIDVRPTGAAIKEALVSTTQKTRSQVTDVALLFRDGRLSIRDQGDPIPPEESSKVLEQMKRPKVYSISTQGWIERLSGYDRDDGSFGDIPSLPEAGVGIGERWTRTQRLRPVMLAPVPRDLIPEVDVEFAYTLRGLEQEGRRQIALIDVAGAPTRPFQGTSGVRAFHYTVSGTSRFDLTGGALVSGKATSTAEIVFRPPSVAPGAPAPEWVKVDTQTRIALDEVPPPAQLKVSSRRAKHPSKRR
jgi:hypothetical protein